MCLRFFLWDLTPFDLGTQSGDLIISYAPAVLSTVIATV